MIYPKLAPFPDISKASVSKAKLSILNGCSAQVKKGKIPLSTCAFASSLPVVILQISPSFTYVIPLIDSLMQCCAIPLIQDSYFSMILFWVAMRSSIRRSKVAILVCSGFDGNPI